MTSPYETKNVPTEDEAKVLRRSPDKAKFWAWTSVCIVFAIISLVYRLLVYTHLEQTALMFIGLPTVLAIMLAATPSAQSITGRIFKGMTMFFLMFGILLIEGVICILMAAPLFYMVGLIIGVIADSVRLSRSRTLRCSVGIVLVFMSIEGITGGLSFEREETVEVSRVYDKPRSEILADLGRGPDFDLGELPGFLKLGFPKPMEISGSGINPGSQWEIYFAGGEGNPGHLKVKVTSASANHVEFTCLSDESHIAHWLSWHTVRWELVEQGPNKTEVKMVIRYRRDLDPAWYFKPIERYGVNKAGGYFMEQMFEEKEE